VHERAAARAKREAVHPLLLREVEANGELVLLGLHLRIADRHVSDVHGRRHVLVQQRRRHLQARRDIVEAELGRVRRQERRDVHREAEEIANRVGVLGAVEPVQHELARIVARSGRTVQ
jgi:hypothetical protein